MIRSWLCIFVVTVVYYFSLRTVQATVFSCNHTAACGCSLFDANINARIVGGEVAASHSWGWMVSLGTRLTNNICGGSILSPNFILTAAHCVEDEVSTPSILSVLVGADTLNSGQGQRIGLSRITIHPRYDTKTKENDIAILRLVRPIDFTDRNVAKICIPTVTNSQQSRYPIVNTPLVATGWGRLSSSGQPSNSLRQVTVKSVENTANKCKSSLNNAQLQFCAAVDGGGKDTCQGDSGGPLVQYSKDKKVWVLAGITSYGRGCALANYAGIYTRVSAYTSWIKSVVGSDGVINIPQNGGNISNNLNLSIFMFILFGIGIRFYN